MKRPMSPCANCPRKGCGAYHDRCDKFQAFINEDKAFMKMVKENRQDDREMDFYISDRMVKILRRERHEKNKL